MSAEPASKFGRVLRANDPRLTLQWSREKIIRSLKDYADVYGPDFTSAAFSPSQAKWRDQPELRDRYYAGNPRDHDRPWPSVNAIKARFDGSFNAARVAAGLEPNKAGPGKNGKRAAGAHQPQRQVVEHLVILPHRKARTALARADRAEAEVTRLKRELERTRVTPRDKDTVSALLFRSGLGSLTRKEADELAAQVCHVLGQPR